MKIYVCDNCGKTEKISGIVGTEFDYTSKWKTIDPRYRFSKPDAPDDQVVDVCTACFELVSFALTTARERTLKAQDAEYYRIIGAAKDYQPRQPPRRPGLFQRMIGRL